MNFRTLFRSPSLLSLILALPFGLVAGCGQTIDLGGNNNLGYEPCPTDDGCADTAHPALACAYGAGDWACVELDSGACAWNLLCPDEPDVCEPADCSADRPAIACAGGGGEWSCEPTGAGGCGWNLACPEPVACDPSECPDAPADLDRCADGTTGAAECVRDASGTCGWEVDCSPPVECTMAECAAATHIAIVCDDGSDGWTCERDDATGLCGWNLVCEDDPGVACTASDCADMPRAALACADGSDGWECVVDAAGDCSWSLQCEPTICNDSDCEGLDMPEFANCEGPATGVLTCAPQAGGCGWNFECVLPSVPDECPVSACPDVHAALACADGSADWQCVYTATMECDWLLECADGSDPSLPPMSGG